MEYEDAERRKMLDRLEELRSQLHCSIQEVRPLEREPSEKDDYVAQRVRQCEQMGIDPLEEMGYVWAWEEFYP
jgi:hypothetical protein